MEKFLKTLQKKVEPTIGFAFNAPEEDSMDDNSDAYDSPDIIKEIPELEGFKPFENIDDDDETLSNAPLDISFDDDIHESLLSTPDQTPEEEFLEEDSAPIDIEDAYSIDAIDIDIDSSEEEIISQSEEDDTDDGFDYSYNYDPQVASDELGLPIDLIEEFIEDFIAQSHEFKNDLFNSLSDGDLDNVKVLSHKLKGVAANLRIEDAFNTLSIINTSSDTAEVESHLNIFYKIIAKLSGEEVASAKPKEVKTAETAFKEVEEIKEPEEIEEESNLYDDDLVIDLKENDSEKSLETQDSVEKDEIENILEDMEISVQEDDEKEIDLVVKDSEVPHKIEMPELADDEFLNNTVEDNTQEDIDIEDLLSVDIGNEDENLTQQEETLSIDDNFEIEKEFEITAHDEPLDIEYSKEIVASEIGLDQESFDEIFEDYIVDSQLLIDSMNEAILENDFSKCKKEALKLKGMSDNMRVNAFNDELNSLINSSDKDELTNAIAKIDAAIAQISK